MSKERFETNAKILTIIADHIIAHPDQRFGQILYNLDIVKDTGHTEIRVWKDEHYLESKDLLARISKSREWKKICSDCQGEGGYDTHADITDQYPCPTCDGTGKVLDTDSDL